MPGGAVDSTGVNEFIVMDIKNQLPQEKAEKVIHLYRILGRIERLTPLTFFYAIFFPFIAIPITFLLGGYPDNFIVRVVILFAFYIIGTILLGIVYFKPHLNQKIRELKNFVSSDYHFPEILETLRGFDSEVVEKTCQFIPKIVMH